RPAATATTAVKSKPQNQGSRPPASSGQKTSNYGSGGRRPEDARQPAQTPEARRRAQAQAQIRASRTAPAPSTEWVKNPIMLALYVLASAAAIFVILTVNVANVQADTLYKQGQAYDGAQRWTDSI